MFYPSREDYEGLAQKYTIVPLFKEVIVDLETPISIFKKVAEKDEESYLLESVEGGNNLARYSFIGIEPFLTFSYSRNRGIIRENNNERKVRGLPLEILKDLMDQYQAPTLQGLPRFYGGAVGYFGYDLIRHYENLPNSPKDDLKLPELSFLFTKIVLIFDHVQHKLKVVVNSRPELSDLATSYEKAMKKIDTIVAKIRRRGSFPSQKINNKKEIKISSNTTAEEFAEKVIKAKEYIKQGDIFQVVLSQRLEAPLDCPPFDIYRSLRTVNPAPYLYYLNFGPNKIIGSSPEMLVRVDQGKVQSCPIAGTRPRGKDEKEDLAFEKELLQDKKELAEHLMLVDLGRNDLGKVCEYGSVSLEKFMSVERYSHVMHLVSNLQGKIGEKENGFTALKATFPAGTVSGAPKIRAMEIIDELENNSRGIYAGAIGYFSFTGNLDTCITIRTILIHNEKVFMQAGAGIVADSDPEAEYKETINKAQALIKTLQIREVIR